LLNWKLLSLSLKMVSFSFIIFFVVYWFIDPICSPEPPPVRLVGLHRTGRRRSSLEFLQDGLHAWIHSPGEIAMGKWLSPIEPSRLMDISIDLKMKMGNIWKYQWSSHWLFKLWNRNFNILVQHLTLHTYMFTCGLLICPAPLRSNILHRALAFAKRLARLLLRKERHHPVLKRVTGQAMVCQCAVTGESGESGFNSSHLAFAFLSFIGGSRFTYLFLLIPEFYDFSCFSKVFTRCFSQCFPGISIIFPTFP